MINKQSLSPDGQVDIITTQLQGQNLTDKCTAIFMFMQGSQSDQHINLHPMKEHLKLLSLSVVSMVIKQTAMEQITYKYLLCRVSYIGIKLTASSLLLHRFS